MQPHAIFSYFRLLLTIHISTSALANIVTKNPYLVSIYVT
jgi:hypothetical protein